MAHARTQAILRSVNRLVAEIPEEEITAALQIRIEQARTLARQLDGYGDGASGALAQAMPAINRELTATLEHILGAHPESDPFLDSLFRDEDGIDVRIKVQASRTSAGMQSDE